MSVQYSGRIEDRRYFFIHIQKTAGTSLRRHMLANFDRLEIYPVPQANKLKTLAAYLQGHALVDLPASEQEKYRLFHGHMPFTVSQRLSLAQPPATLTLLREPVARTLSVLGQKKLHRPEFAEASLEEIYENSDIFTGEILNHQAKIFAVPDDHDMLSGFGAFPVGPAELETAKRNLEKVDVVGLQSDMGAFIAELEQKFGWKILAEDVKENVGSAPDVSQSFLERIEEDNALDIEFYRFAEALVASRAA